MSEILNPWKSKSIKEVYDNPWIQVSHRDVINPSGGTGIYGKVHFKNYAIAILPLDKDYNTWLVGQYRYTINEYSWEIPEGGGSLYSSAEEAAKRELLEETGIEAKELVKVIDEMHMSNSVTDEIGISFVAKDLIFGEPTPDDTEQLDVKKLPFEEVYRMAMDGKIKDTLTLVTVFKTKLLIDEGVI